MKYLLTAALCVVLFQQLAAQALEGSIKGKVKNSSNESLAGATIVLTGTKDSADALTMRADNNGSFLFERLASGTYYLTITAAGTMPYSSPHISLGTANMHIELPVIILRSSKSSELKEVVVTSKRRLIEQDIDKTIVNVDAMISSATSNALEILGKTPGVTVSINNEIGLNGKEGVLVMIDGRPTYLSANDLAAYLKSIPGNLLDKIELMDNPSAKYDAAGSGIINIRLKKNRAGGLTGNIATAYSQGVYTRSNESINLNYNRKKVNLFGSFSYGREKHYNADGYQRQFFDDNKLLQSSVALENMQRYTTTTYYSRLGMDYFASSKTTYGFILNLNKNPRQASMESVSTSFNETNGYDSVGLGLITGTGRRDNPGANINFTHKFNNNGHELSADANYINYTTPGEQYFNNSMAAMDGTSKRSEQFFYDLLPAIDIYTVKVDYMHPFKNKALMEAGVKSGFVNNDDNARYFDVEQQNYIPDYSRSNHFIYKEQVHAAYANAKKSWKRLGLQLGLRAEHTVLSGTLAANPAMEKNTFSRKYTSLFPSVFMSYKLDSNGNNALAISVARRIRRPNYQQLNPFVAYRDNYSYTTGNPLIAPQYQYRTEIKYQHRQWLVIGLQYGHFTDIIFDVTNVVDEVFITRPDNVATGNMIVLATNVNKNIFSWWSMNVNLMLAHLSLNGMAYSEKLAPSTYAMRLNFFNQFSFKKGWGGEATLYYSGKDISGQTITKPRYRVYGAVQKKIFKDKGALRLSLEDIFHSWVQKDHAVGLKQATAYHVNESDTQRIGIAFTWRFGKESFARKRKHSDNAADAEAERAN